MTAALAGCLAISACTSKGTPPVSTTETFIPVDSANKMLGSYLNSIQYSKNDSDLRSIIIDANALREYLTSAEGQQVTQMKVMFAHTLNYVNSGGGNMLCGYRSGALTVVLAGYNEAGNYIYHNGNEVMDNGIGCPQNCPTSGQAAGDFLPSPTAQ